MECRIFAQFGLFSVGKLLEAGTIEEMMQSAKDYAKINKNVKYNIAYLEFADINDDDNTEVTQGAVVLSYYQYNGVIYVTN